MSQALTEARKNGVALPATPVHTATITLDAIGYVGWWATVQTNPRASVYDDLRSFEEGRWWPALGKIVLDWNFPNPERTAPLPLPRDLVSEKELNVPVGVILTYLVAQFFDAVNAAAVLPKAPVAESSTMLPTNGVGQEVA